MDNSTNSQDDDHVINDVVYENQEIFNRISTELLKAQKSIKIAMAWFTDGDLLAILETKALNGVNIQIILADVADNEKLDFSKLENLGGSVLVLGGSGYTKMHHKLCIIDDKTAISGSYNWTMNARRNNHETVTITNIPSAVTTYITIFNQLKNNILNGPNEGEQIPYNKPKESNMDTKPNETISLTTAYENVINKIIDTEVSNFDKKLVTEMGYGRAKASHGDHNIIPKALDSLYNTFLNDIKIIDEKKERLSNKIKEQEKIYTANLNGKLNIELNQLETNFEIDKSNAEGNIKATESLVASNQLDQKGIRENNIPNLKRRIESLKTEKGLKEQETKPQIKNKSKIWFYSILIAVIAIYLLLFYSSAIYLMVSGYDKAFQYQQLGENQKLLQFSVFYPFALSNAYNDNGFVNLIFLLLGTAIFISVPIIFNIIKFPKKYLNHLAVALFTIAIDILIAYKITVILKRISFLSSVSQKTDQIKLSEIFLDSNFWSVILLGSLALFIFHIIYDKLVHLIKEKSPTELEYKKQLEIQNIENQITSCQSELEAENDNLISIQKEELVVQAKLETLKENIQLLPKKYAGDKFNIEEQHANDIRKIQDLSQIYINLVQNEKIAPSDISLADRFNCFFEGWVNLLHEDFSIPKAEAKTQEAKDIINNWNKIDIFESQN